jgi:hypothetical protein
VNIENVQKDTQAVEATLGLNGDHFAVGGGNCDRTGGNVAVGIAKEIKAEKGEKGQRGRKPGSGEPENQRAGGAESERVVDTCGYDLQTTIFACAGAY